MPFKPTPIRDFIGAGLTFPIELNANGTAIVSTGWPLIRSSINALLSWYVGTRFFLGEYGSRIEELLQEASTQILYDTLVTFSKDAIRTFEKRVEVLDVEVVPTEDRTRLDVNLTLRMINTYTEASEEIMTWPFYTKVNR